MLKHLFFVFIIFMLQSSSYASDEFDEEEIEAESPEVVDSFSRTYGVVPYPWQQWNFQSYQPRPRIPQSANENAESAPYADPRFVTNRCHSGYSYTTTTYPCTTIFTATTVTTTTTVTVTTTIIPTTTAATTTIGSTTPASTTTQSTTPTTTPAQSTTSPTSTNGPLFARALPS